MQSFDPVTEDAVAEVAEDTPVSRGPMRGSKESHGATAGLQRMTIEKVDEKVKGCR